MCSSDLRERETERQRKRKQGKERNKRKTERRRMGVERIKEGKERKTLIKRSNSELPKVFIGISRTDLMRRLRQVKIFE